MKKLSKYIIVLALLCLVTGCGKKETAASEEVSTITVEKKGAVVGKIVEDFDQPYYDEKELEEEIKNTISEFNGTAGKDQVSCKSCERVDNKVAVSMEYKDVAAYRDFNHVDFFYGTISEAYDAGYNLDIKLTDPQKGTTVGKADLMAMGDSHIVIVSEQLRISCFGNIKYLSEGVTLVNEKEADNTNTEGNGIIVF